MSNTATLWSMACQAPLIIKFPRQEYWSGLPCPSPEDLPDPGIKPMSIMSPTLACGFFTTGALLCLKWQIAALYLGVREGLKFRGLSWRFGGAEIPVMSSFSCQMLRDTYTHRPARSRLGGASKAQSRRKILGSEHGVFMPLASFQGYHELFSFLLVWFLVYSILSVINFPSSFFSEQTLFLWSSRNTWKWEVNFLAEIKS